MFMEEVSTRSMPPEELRRCMRFLGLQSQQQLAQAIGVNRSTVTLWINGKVGVPRPCAMLLRMLVNARHRNYSDGSGVHTLRAQQQQ
jgi:transcriptional regulator with XRE-family HTH domain